MLRSTKSCDIHALKVKSIIRNASSEPLEWYGQQRSVRELCWIPLTLLPARLLTPPPLMASSRKDEGGAEGEIGRRKRNMKMALRLVGDAKAVSSSVIEGAQLQPTAADDAAEFHGCKPAIVSEVPDCNPR